MTGSSARTSSDCSSPPGRRSSRPCAQSWSPPARSESMSSNEEDKKVRRSEGEKGGSSLGLSFSPSYLRTFSPSSLILAVLLVLAMLGWIATALWGDRQRAWG